MVIHIPTLADTIADSLLANPVLVIGSVVLMVLAMLVKGLAR